MKIKIWTDSEKEFEQKRPELLKALASSKYDLVLKGNSITQGPKQPRLKAQKEMLQYWNDKFKGVLSDIKRDIAKVIDE